MEIDVQPLYLEKRNTYLQQRVIDLAFEEYERITNILEGSIFTPSELQINLSKDELSIFCLLTISRQQLCEVLQSSPEAKMTQAD